MSGDNITYHPYVDYVQSANTLFAVNLLPVVLLPLLILFLKQPRELGHKDADRSSYTGDVHWFYGIDSFGCIHRFCGVLFLQNGSIVILVIRFFLIVQRV